MGSKIISPNKKNSMPVAVAIVDDNKDLRMGTSYVLSSSPAFKVVGAYETAEGLIEAFDDIIPDVVLMDIELPGMNGIQATEILKKIMHMFK